MFPLKTQNEKRWKMRAPTTWGKTQLAAMLILFSSAAAFGQYETEQKAPTSSFQWPRGKRAALSLTFDDGRPSQLDKGIPILDRHGVKATFYVNPRPVALRASDWKKVHASGHEIGNHTLNHPCTGNFPWARENALEGFTIADIAHEIDATNRSILGLVGLYPATFAYPCGQKFIGRGAGARSYVPLIAERFLAGRGWLDEGANDPAFCDLAQLLGRELDGLSFREAKEWIDEALSGGMWLVFCGHDIGDPAAQTVLSTTLNEVCRYAADPSTGIWVDTVEHIAEYVAAQR